MMQCHDCRTLLLDHAYGLLDEAEAATVRTHLAECPACTAAAADVLRTQGLFARAAKSEFPNVSFAPPVEEPVVPFTPRRKSRSTWAQWAVAAAVLAMIPGALVPIRKLADRYETAKRDVDDAETRAAKAKAEYELHRADSSAQAQLDAARQKQISVVSSWANDLKTEAARRVSVAITKPRSVVPGAPNEYVIAVADPGDTLAGSRVEAQFRDEAGQVLHTQAVLPKADTTVRLPAEVWKRVTPQTELVLSVSSVNAASGARTELQEPIRLFGPVYATMLTTDKTAYRPGEQLHFRSLTLDRITFRPPTRDQNLRFTLRKVDGSGTVLELTGTTNLLKDANGTLTPITDAAGEPVRGVGCGSFLLPADLTEGEYALSLTELPGAGGAPPVMAFPVVKSIQVRAGGPEKFTKKLTFNAPSYTLNQDVTATVELKLGDQPVAGAKGRIILTADGKTPPMVIRPEPQSKRPDGTLIMLSGTTDAAGRFRMHFKLPAGADIRLAVTFDEVGGNETVSERVPVAGKEVSIEFFPEGGKLLADVPNRVYVRGTAANGKPIDVRGTIALGNEIVARVESPADADEPGANRGVGSFSFTPKGDAIYQLRLQTANPAAPAATFDLPKAMEGGVSFTALDTVVSPGQPIRVRVHSVGKDRSLVVGAYTRGRLADSQSVMVKAGTPVVVTLLAKSDARGGVTRITVFEETAGADLVPVAERLVFRKPGEELRLTAIPAVSDRAVDLQVIAKDEKGNAVPAILWAAAVNAAVAPDAKHRALPTHFLLAGEVQTPDDLEHADFLLTDHPKAAEALDHVLATQGWRRFVEQVHVTQPGSAADSLLKLHGKHRTKATGPSLADKYWPQFESTTEDVERAREKVAAAEPVMLKLYAEYESSRRTTEDLAAAVQTAAGPYEQIRDRLTFASGCVGLLCAMLGALALVRGLGLSGSLPYFVGSIAAAGLAVYLSLDASRYPATIPPVQLERVEAPKGTEPEKTPDVKLPAVQEKLDTPSGEPFRLFGIGSQRLVGPRGAEVLKLNPSIPDEMPKLPFRAPPGQTVLDAILAAEHNARTRAESFAKEDTLDSLRKIETALLGSGLQADEAANRIRSSASVSRPLVVREFAPSRPAIEQADTVMWKPVIVLPTDGKTHLHFQLGSAPGGYQVIVAGHSTGGRLGSTRLIVK